ncbi:MAG: hypothetical protein WC405_11155 [Syntrophales bacterium]
MVKSALGDIIMPAGNFHFQRLVIDGVNNDDVLAANKPEMANEETCLFHNSTADGNAYQRKLQDRVEKSLADRLPLPVVRFADGEYAFYALSLDCNGLYRQAESTAAIKAALPLHTDALARLSREGVLAPLIFPGNVEQPRQGIMAIVSRLRKRPSASTFLKLLGKHRVTLTGDNYIPFYVVYAWLSSAAFARLMNGRKICFIGSECDQEACRRWFARFDSRPETVFAEIPAEYVATRWSTMKDHLLSAIPANTDLCLVGAGIGALPVCVDTAASLSIPVIDAGHVFNMMNDRVDKSNGARLYTHHRP